MLLTWNNLAYYQSLMADIRASIESGPFAGSAGVLQEGWESGGLPPV